MRMLVFDARQLHRVLVVFVAAAQRADSPPTPVPFRRFPTPIETAVRLADTTLGSNKDGATECRSTPTSRST